MTAAALLALALAAAQSPAGEATPPAQPAVPEVVPPAEPPPPAERTPRYVVEKLDLRGLDRTRASEVRKHLLVAEGDLLDPDRVSLSRLRLLQLGWFSKVETRVERGSARGLVVVVFELAERNTIVLSDLVFGWTPAQPFYGGFGVAQQNFLGRGLSLSGAFVYGGAPQGRPQDPDRFAARTSLFAPDLAMGKRRLVLGTTLWFMRGEEFACGDPGCEAYDDVPDAPRLVYQRGGVEASVGVRSGPFERLIASYKIEGVSGAGDDLAAGAGPYLLQGRSRVSALGLTWERDTRDDFFFPTEGLRTLAQITFGSRLVGSDYEYSRYLLQLETAYALFHRPLRLQAGVGASQGSAPFFERFYAADASYFAIGPALARALELNFSTDSRYDAFLAVGGLEYAIPLFTDTGFFRRGYLALGARGVYSTATLGGDRTRVSRSPFSGDVALRLDTPVGDFNVSLAYVLDIVL